MTTLLQELSSILLEYKREITEKSLGSKLSSAGDADDGSSLAKVLDTLEEADPTKNKQYVEWMCRQYIQGKFKLEDHLRVKEVLVRFEKIKNKLDQRDVNKYNFHELQNLMDEHFEDVKLNDVDAKAVKGAKILYDGPHGQLAIPTNKKASCELGSGTKWCTAGRENNQFTNYNSRGPLYIWKDKSGEKYQFHFETGQFMNDKDQPISDAKVDEFRNKSPVIKKLFAQKESELIQKLKTDGQINAMTSYGGKFVKGHWPALEKQVLDDNNAKAATAYVIDVLKKPWPAGEKLISTDPEQAYRYAVHVLKKPWPEGEKAILKDRHWGVLYSQKFPKTSFKDFAKKH